MASAFIRTLTLTRASLSSSRLPITISKSTPAARSSFHSVTTRVTLRSSALRFQAFSRSTCRASLRLPVELACCSGSLLPLHTAVAEANITSQLSLASWSCRALSQGIVFS